MPRFASRDLMVATLPQDGDEAWEMAGSSCAGCTNDTKGACATKPKPKPKADLRALQEQLRALRV
ncbi:MAG TPA: hypothetical protein VGQ73_07705 [Gemmatimonadales bacterium]|jgi:hypothetical protein|nr:hypothetical protein [Gemmatimonadales bacterium]